MNLLEVRHLNQSFGKEKILSDISFALSESIIVALLGPNGAGKTTLLRTIIGLLPSENDTIFWRNEAISNWPTHKRIASGIAYLPQQSSLFSALSCVENLKLIYENHSSWSGKSLKSFEEEMYNWLEKVFLTSAIAKKASELSGGQKRKLEVVRALLMHPKLIMLDEPFAGVDPKSIYELKTLFVELSKKEISLLISDHYVDQLLSIASSIHVVLSGKIIVSGSVAQIMSNTHTKELYFGTQFFEELSKKFPSPN